MKCHICSKVTPTFLDEKSGISYGYCQSCAYIFKSEEQHQSIEAQKSRYDLHENSEEDPGYQAYFQRFLDFVLPHMTNSVHRALDFGCGRSSLLSQMLENEGYVCDFYDPVYHPDRSYQEQTYDFIVSTEVFEHLHDPLEVFKHLITLLNKNGYLAIQTQFHPNEIEAFKKWYYHLDPTHIVFFTPNTFKVLSEMFGCRYLGDNGKNMVVIQKQ